MDRIKQHPAPSTRNLTPFRPLRALCGRNSPIRGHSRALAVPPTSHLTPITYHLPPDTCSPATPAGPAAPPYLTRRRAAFTILELLATITLLAMLMATVTMAAQYVVRSVKTQRMNITAKALEVAICQYRTTYGNWPISTNLASTIAANPFIGGTNNYLVFDLLRASSNDTRNPFNTNNIPFLDISTVLSLKAGNQLTPRHLLPADPACSGLVEPNRPIVYQNPSGGYGYYNISFNFELDTVSITP